MKLSKLLANVPHKKKLDGDPEIESITCDSTKVKKNCLFACLKGVNFDGHSFAQNALNSGAAAVLVEKNLNLPNQIVVENSHLAYAQICGNYFDNPAKKLKLVGITGTNGKTTITKITKTLLQSQNKKVGLIGTIQNEIGTEIQPTEKTTPTHFDFQKLIYTMAQKKCEFVVMEVSSHALDQHRTGNTQFEVGVFSNLSQDHLDYHKTMEAYYNAKKRLFNNCKRSLICIDCPAGTRLATELEKQNKQPTTFSINNKNADFFASNIQLESNKVVYSLNGPDLENKTVEFSTPGLFSVQNSMAAIVCCILLGVDKNLLFETIKTCKPIKGRSEIIKTNLPFTVICDYAHTPDGLQNILKSIQSYCKGKIIVVFGCGGDRDAAKRPIMGEIAAKNADFLVVTSDNPRTENPEKIVDEIETGILKIKSKSYVKIVNRKKAIEFALKKAKPGDIVLLAGKGHEPYQIVGTKKLPFNEPEIVQQLASEIF